MVGALLIAAFVFGVRKVQRDIKKRHLSFSDLQKLAGNPGGGQPQYMNNSSSGNMIATSSPGNSAYRPNQVVAAANPQYAHTPTQQVKADELQPKTAYQQAFEKQQQQLANPNLNRSLSVAPPSARMSQLAAAARVGSGGPGRMTRLVAIYDFIGERADELNVVVGTKMTGIEEQDMWWLASTFFFFLFYFFFFLICFYTNNIKM